MKSACFIHETGGRSQTLRFEADRLVVLEADERSAREFVLAYLDIDLANEIPPPPNRPLRKAFAALTGGWRTTFVRFRLFTPRPGRETLDIWRGPQAQEIVAELKTRWLEARKRAVVVDFATDPRREMARFETLLERGIISAEEAAAAAARIVARTPQFASRP